MIRYSFFMSYGSYSRFSDWLALEFEILCVVPDGISIGWGDEEPVEGYFDVPKSQFEAFLKRWKEVEDEFHVELINRGTR